MKPTATVWIIAIMLCLGLSPAVLGQQAGNTRWTNFNLQPGAPLADNLLQTKTVVLFHNPGLTFEALEGFLLPMQQVFHRTGVDAVAYYDIDQVFAGEEVRLAYGALFIQRGIRHVAFLDWEGTSPKTARYTLALTAFSGDTRIVTSGQPAWTLEHSTDLNALYRAASAQSLQRTNLLINEWPELGPPTRFITGTRNESFSMDLRIDRLAIPAAELSASDSLALSSALTIYPHRYQLVAPGSTEQEYYRMGYQFILYRVYAPGGTIRQLLGYADAGKDKELVATSQSGGETIRKTYPADLPVYKYYIKHLRTGNLFLGTPWDASPDWEEALRNHLANLRMAVPPR
jgi:hypothetical protein